MSTITPDGYTTAGTTIFGALVGGGAVLWAARQTNRRETRSALEQLVSLLATIEYDSLAAATGSGSIPVAVMDEFLKRSYAPETSRALLSVRDVRAFYNDVSALRTLRSEASIEGDHAALAARIINRCKICRGRLGDHHRVTRPTSTDEVVGFWQRARDVRFCVVSALLFGTILLVIVYGILERLHLLFAFLLWRPVVFSAWLLSTTAVFAKMTRGWIPPPARSILARAREKTSETLWNVVKSLAVLPILVLFYGLGLDFEARLQRQLTHDSIPNMLAAAYALWLFRWFLSAFVISGIVGWVAYVLNRIVRVNALRSCSHEITLLDMDGVCAKYPDSTNIPTPSFCKCPGTECVAKRYRL